MIRYRFFLLPPRRDRIPSLVDIDLPLGLLTGHPYFTTAK